MFLGTASTSASASQINQKTGSAGGEDILRSGIWTKKSFLHSLGLVICAGTKGY